jgi:hypothetical protein
VGAVDFEVPDVLYGQVPAGELAAPGADVGLETLEAGVQFPEEVGPADGCGPGP